MMACCALFALFGCQPVQVVQPAGMAPPPGSQPVFAGPPVVSGQGVMVDPFAMQPGAGPVVGAPFAGGGDAPALSGITSVPGLIAAPGVVSSDGGASRIHVPANNPDWAWEQIVDVVDDYFNIERERQVQLVGDVMTEGRIDVQPQIGATIVEPHRRDSVGRYNRWESTFQTIRRRATIRVIPDAGGYCIEAVVEKDLEDLPRPEESLAGTASFRNDNSLSDHLTEPVSRTQLAGRWILVGRDPALEQQMLSEIQARLVNPPAL
jgi:hypothetical protein